MTLRIVKATPPRGRGIRHPTRIHRAAAAAEPRLRGVVLDAIRLLRRFTDDARLVATIPGGAAHVMAAINWPVFAGALTDVLEPIETGLVASARAEIDALRRMLRTPIVSKADGEIRGALNVRNPWAIRAANEQAARLIRQATAEAQRAIRAIITHAQQQGLSVAQQKEQIAEILRQSIGLTERQSLALLNYRTSLEQQGLDPERVAQLVGDYSDRLLEQRAEMIARQESMTAANAGQDSIWRTAREQGLIPADSKRKWLTARGPRTCAICRPMHGQVQPLGVPFVSPYDGTTVEMPPAHIQCRCTLVLVVEDV